MTTLHEIEQEVKEAEEKKKQYEDDLKQGKIMGEASHLSKQATQYAVETRCNDCIFAKPKPPESWTCEFGLPKMFLKQGYKKDIVDGDWKISGKACWSFRTSIWAKANNLETLEQQKAKLDEEICLKVDVIVYFKAGQDLGELKKTIESLENNEHHPTKIYIANTSEVPPSRLIEWCQHNISLPWSVEFVADTNIMSCLNVMYKKTKSVYVSVFRAGFVIPKKYFKKINKIIYKDMERILAILPIEEYNGFTFLRILGKQLGYNTEKCMIEKLKEVVESQNSQFLLKEHKEIFNDS